jgi:hypothetical protein
VEASQFPRDVGTGPEGREEAILLFLAYFQKRNQQTLEGLFQHDARYHTGGVQLRCMLIQFDHSGSMYTTNLGNRNQ